MSWFHWFRRQPTRRHQPHRFQPVLDVLEDRSLPTVTLQGSLLTVTGDNGGVVRDDQIQVLNVIDGGTEKLQVFVNNVREFDRRALDLLGSLRTIVVNGSAGKDEITVDLTRILSGVLNSVTINGGVGDDTIRSKASLRPESAPSQSRLTVNGDFGSDRVEVNDQDDADPSLQAYRVQDSAIEFVSSTSLRRTSYASVEDLVLNTSTRTTANVFIESTTFGSAVTVNAGRVDQIFSVGTHPTLGGLSGLRGTAVNINGLGDNTLILDDQTSGAGQAYWIYASKIYRVGVADVNFSGVGNVPINAGAFDDSFVVLGTPATARVAAVGGGGRNAVDYSSFLGSVQVNLAANTATALAGGVFGVQSVVGSFYDDSLTGDGNDNILVGLGGNDTLNGADGRDILIGGYGQDTLTGGPGEDIVIGGTTSYDDRYTTITLPQPFRFPPRTLRMYVGVDHAALQTILMAWESSDSPTVRRNRIGSGVGSSGQYKLDTTTVQDDGIADTTNGPVGDWVWL